MMYRLLRGLSDGPSKFELVWPSGLMTVIMAVQQPAWCRLRVFAPLPSCLSPTVCLELQHQLKHLMVTSGHPESSSDLRLKVIRDLG